MSAKSASEAESESRASTVGVDDDSFEAFLRQGRASEAAHWGARALLPVGTTLSGGRLSVLRRIGEGGMGAVYEVFDSERKARLALKTLIRLDAENVYRLKNEFRILADVTHPNLVRLHELFSERDAWFFTMELVDGEPFDRWVRPHDPAHEGRAQDGGLDEGRLRASFPQLVSAVSAIHRAGKLHRDLKPSNVLVTPDGRVVVLDFGLAVDRELGGVGRTLADDAVSGTPAYMAPEQAASQPATQASDYYALGVMLFEALTGRLPFEGHIGAMLAAKLTRDAPQASDVHPSAPADLDALCTQLLLREPSARPDSAGLRHRLGVTPQVDAASRLEHSSLAPDVSVDLLGREAELAALRRAYDATISGKPLVLFVSGESGMGKSALCDAFLAELHAVGDAVVLSGRCYERENVPYKGFDALIDELSRYLRKLPPQEAAALLPREVFALVRLFPVLDRVPVVAGAPKKDVPDPQELQSRAFLALRDLLGAMRDRRPLVLYIDDLQWVDRDTTVLLGYLLSQFDTMPVLAIGSHRTEGMEENALLRTIREGARENRALDVRELRVGPLPTDAADALARRALGARGDVASLAASVSHEAQGSPFFVRELARFARREGATRLHEISLDEALADHVALLPEGARSLLEMLALAGQPLSSSVVVDAANVLDGHAALDLLRSEQLVRGSTGVRRVECYHDRVRESVSGALAAKRRTELYAALAHTLQERDDADSELLATCYEGAGENEPAARAAEVGGDRSVTALAFERAARLYERALELGSFDENARRALEIKHGDALVGAGRGPEAARIYRKAAATAEVGLALELKRKAGLELMISGHADEGRALFGEVLSAIGLRLPSSPKVAIARALLSRARLKLRGLDLNEHAETPLPSDIAHRLDVLWLVEQGFTRNDPMVMADMHARFLRLALDAGSAPHVAQGLAKEGYIVGLGGPPAERRATALTERAIAIAERVTEPEVLGHALVNHGAVLCITGRFERSRRHLARALEFLHARCRSVAGVIASLHAIDQVNAYSLGRFGEIVATAPPLIADTIRRGDLWSATILASAQAVPAWLAAGDSADVRARFEQSKRRHSRQSQYQLPELMLLLAELRLLRYEGNPGGALALAGSQWPVIVRAQLMRAELQRARLLHERGSSAVGTLRQRGSDAVHARGIAGADARHLRRSHMAFSPALAALLEAALAQADDQSERAVRCLRFAIDNLDTNEMTMYAAAARRRLGELVGGDEGKVLLGRGDATMLAQGVKNLDSMTEMLVPGCRTR